MNDTLFLTTCALAVSQLLFMAASYLLHYHKLVLGRLMGLFSLGLMSYIFLVALGGSQSSSLTTQLFRIGAMLTPALLWVISRHLFQENTRIRPAFWAMVATYIGIRIIGHILYPAGLPTTGTGLWLFRILPQTAMALLAAHAIYLAARNGADDLVEPRRQIRVPFVMIMGMIVMVIVLSGFISPLINNDIRTIYAALILLCALALNIATFRLHQDASQLIFPATRSENVTSLHAREPGNKALAQRIREALETDNLYANPQLTIGELARTLSMPEYILRRFINKQLGYRNFNQFLNKCRIEHAAERLRNVAEQRLPISTIAMGVGYNSLSTFNKSFKQLHGLTPSEYRARNAVNVCAGPPAETEENDEPDRLLRGASG
ncbi:MAG: helix-turn-helix transcriptional regulator [Pseudohongiellaceae bacterium]